MSRDVLHYGDSSGENSHESSKRSNCSRKRRSKKSGCRSSNHSQGSAARSSGSNQHSLRGWRMSSASDLDNAGWMKVIDNGAKGLFDSDSGVCLNKSDFNKPVMKTSTKSLDREISLDFDNSLLPEWSNFSNPNVFKKQCPKSCGEDARNVGDLETVPTRFPSNLFSLPACSPEFSLFDDSSIHWSDSKSQDCLRSKCEPVKPEAVSSSTGSINFNRRPMDSRLKNLSTSQSAKDISEMTRTLARLTHLKQTNQIAVANYLKDVNNQRVKSNGEVPERAKENDSSNNSIEPTKWNFPSSNRKREEKLRVRGSGMNNGSCEPPFSKLPNRNANSNVNFHPNFTSPSDICAGGGKHDLNAAYVPRVAKSKSFDETNFKMTLTLESSDQSQVSIMRENSSSSSGTSNDFNNSGSNSTLPCGQHKSNRSSASNLTVSANDSCASVSDAKGGGSDGNEINTQSALIKISETLIESAQRAEILLMQKMKEYNDLVCRETPVKRVRDFDCQAQIDVVQAEPDFDNKINKMKDQYLGEINDKNTIIQRLEMEKKKLKQALKKTTLGEAVGRKIQSESGCHNQDLEGAGDASTLRSDFNLTTSDQPEKQKQHDELFHALKMENHLLHTLLKEMKLELDQENATIMSLAKKLETNMGIQNQIKTRQPDIVKELEDKLEMQERMLKQEAMEARAIAKYAIIKYKRLIQEYKERVKGHQYTVDKLTNAIK